MDTHKHLNVTGTAACELRDDQLDKLTGQLDKLTGGLVVNSLIAVLIGMLIPDVRPLRAQTEK